MRIFYSRIVISTVLFLIFLSGCTVRLVSLYDEQTDAGATALHKKFEDYFSKLKIQQKPECTYPNYKEFYRQTKSDVAALKLRAEAIPKNTKTIEAVAQMDKIVDTLEKIHQGRVDAESNYICMNLDALGADQQGVNSALGAILKLELAKKRGEE